MAASFQQPQGKSMWDLSVANYNEFAREPPIWINGHAQGLPRNTTINDDGAFHIDSPDWAALMVAGLTYEIRQQIINFVSGAEKIVDVAYTFTYNGFVTQNQSPELADRAWILTNRTVLQDTSGVAWDVKEETVRFWLPYTSGVTGFVYVAYEGFATTANLQCDDTGRGCGSAGIIGEAADGMDPAASWAPHFNTGNAFDIAFVHQLQNSFAALTQAKGVKTGPMTLHYWLRKVT